jgi:hypothetical protein
MRHCTNLNHNENRGQTGEQHAPYLIREDIYMLPLDVCDHRHPRPEVEECAVILVSLQAKIQPSASRNLLMITGPMCK